jgi:hypothetical protein
MAERIKAMRAALLEALRRRGTPGNWSHVTSQIGMFTFSGLTRSWPAPGPRTPAPPPYTGAAVASFCLGCG